MAEEKLRSFLIEELEVNQQLVDDAIPLLDGGLIDSLGVLSIIAFCEEELSCVVPEEEIVADDFQSLAALVEAVDRWSSTGVHD